MGDWNELAAQQRANRETADMEENQRLFDQYGAIEKDSRQQEMLRDKQMSIAGAAMMASAYRNGGMSDRSLGVSFSQAFGQPVVGGQIVDLGKERGRGFVIYGTGKDANGKATVNPVAMMDDAQMMRVLQRAGLGDRTLGLQKEIYGELSSRYTADQIGNMGIRNPSAPISTGGAVISAAGMRALRGTPRTPSRIESFSADGMGGFSRSAYDRKTGENWQEDYGTRSPDDQVGWKVLESGPDGMRYENDKTGEVVNVPKGSSLGDVIAARTRKPTSGLTFDERRQLQQEKDDRLDAREQSAQQARRQTEEERSKRHLQGLVNAWDNTRYAAIQKQLDSMRRARDKRGNPQYTEEQIKAKWKELYDLFDIDRANTFPELYEKNGVKNQQPAGQGQASSDDNGSNETVKEFDPKGKYKAGDKFSRKGIVYEVGADGQPHKVK